MAYWAGRVIGNRLCEVFGLDPSNVNSVRFEANVDDAVFIVVKRYVNEDEIARVEEILQEYSLVPKDEE